MDEEKERVRFWGHDGPMEITFLLKRVQTGRFSRDWKVMNLAF
jgi:hypothetical protein